MLKPHLFYLDNATPPSSRLSSLPPIPSYLFVICWIRYYLIFGLLRSSQKLFNCQQMSERRLWTSQEDSIILELVKSYGSKRWTEIAQDMKLNYPHLARSSKQIRQRWYNHLDPDINTKPWTLEEEVIIFEAHKKLGSRWKQIAKLFVSRTDNSIKNHFYSTLRRSLRRINKFLGFKNSTNQMRVLKPSILCKLIEDGQNSREFRALIDGIFQFAKFKPNKSLKSEDGSLIGEQKLLFKQAIEKLTEFNSRYERNEHTKKNYRRSKNAKGKIVPQHETFQSSTTELEIEISSEKDQEEQNNSTQHELCKGSQYYGDEQNQDPCYSKILSNQFENGWGESNHKQFLNEFPQLENPDHEHDFMPLMPLECKEQELFP